MTVYLNQKEFSTDAARLTVAEVISLNQLPPVGLAVAVNNKVVRKAEWQTTELAEGDKITVITAVCGG